jgi:hypothetical protein
MAIKIVDISSRSGIRNNSGIQFDNSSKGRYVCITTGKTTWSNGNTKFVSKKRLYEDILGFVPNINYPDVEIYLMYRSSSSIDDGDTVNTIRSIKPDILIFDDDNYLAEIVSAKLMVPLFVPKIDQTLTKMTDIFQDQIIINFIGNEISVPHNIMDFINIKFAYILQEYRFNPIIKNSNRNYIYTPNANNIDKSHVEIYLRGIGYQFILYKTIETAITMIPENLTIAATNDDIKKKLDVVLDKISDIKSEIDSIISQLQ